MQEKYWKKKKKKKKKKKNKKKKRKKRKKKKRKKKKKKKKRKKKKKKRLHKAAAVTDRHCHIRRDINSEGVLVRGTVAGQPGTVACLVPCSTPPGFPDIAAQEEDITAQWADVADAPPAGCFVPPSYCSAPPGIPDVAAPVHSHAPLPASPCSRSPAGAVVTLDIPSGSLLADPGSCPGNAGGTDPPSSPPVEKGEN
ncbi:UNVERIFIED_CONTAM: hypothetical protein FKN15_019253 [Acipenser sinensis]